MDNENNVNSEIVFIEDYLGPPKSDIVSVGIISVASIVAGFIGGLFLLICTFFFLTGIKWAAPAVFPYVLALVAFVAILCSSYLNFYFSRLIFPEKYASTVTVSAQVFTFSLLMYLIFTPLYVFAWWRGELSLMGVYVVHVLTAVLWTTLIVEILSNYRYVLLSIYAAFFGFFGGVFSSLLFFLSDSSNSVKILSALSITLILAFFFTTLFRSFFEFIYYKLYTLSGQDVLWSLFSEIEKEEREREKFAEKNLTTF